jgi:hypothetical protein
VNKKHTDNPRKDLSKGCEIIFRTNVKVPLIYKDLQNKAKWNSSGGCFLKKDFGKIIIKEVYYLIVLWY